MLQWETKVLYVSQGLANHKVARISFVGLDWKPMPFHGTDYKPFEELPLRAWILKNDLYCKKLVS